MTVLRRAFERRSTSYDPGRLPDSTIPPPGYLGINAAGVAVDEQTALMQADVWACSSIIAEAIAMLPLDAYRKTQQVLGDGGIFDVRQPVASWLDDPHPELDPVEWKTRMLMSTILRGRACAAVTAWDRNGYPAESWPIHPDDWRIRRDKTTNVPVIDVQPAGSGKKQTLYPGEYIHLKGLTLPGALTGCGVVDYHRRAIGLGIATEEFGAAWFRDGAAPSSVLETDAAADDVRDRRMQARWMASNGGRRRPVVLSGGLKWRAITITPEESQFLATMKFNTERIARLFRVPLHMIQSVDKSTSWGTGIEEQGIGFVVFTLGIWIARLEACLFKTLPRPQYAKVNVNALLRGNTKDRYLSYAIGRQWGWLSVNDIRRLEEQPPVEGGDTYLQPLNMVDAQDALKILLADKTPAPTGGGA